MFLVLLMTGILRNLGARLQVFKPDMRQHLAEMLLT